MDLYFSCVSFITFQAELLVKIMVV